MISEQIIEDYLEQASESSNKLYKLKVSLLFIAIIGLIMISLI